MKNWKSIAVLLLVFFTGIIVGVVGTRTVIRHFVQRAIMQPERVQLFVERDLSWKLGLDRSQRIKLHEILSDSRNQLHEVREQIQPQTSQIFSNANAQITAMLTPQQQAAYDHFKSSNFLLSHSQQSSPPSHVLP